MAEQEQALVQEIMADARRRAERIRHRAERDAEQITGQAEKEAQAERDRVLEAARRRVAREQEVMHARIEHELVELRLRVRHEMVEHVRSEAEDRLAELARTEEHRPVLVRLALLAIQAMTGGEFRLMLRPEDRDRWHEGLAAEIQEAAGAELGREVRVQVAQDTIPALGGLVVTGANGHESADQTFDARLRRLWDQIRTQVALSLPDISGTSR